MTDSTPEQEAPAAESIDPASPPAPVEPPTSADESVRLVLVPDAFTESYLWFDPRSGTQIRIDATGVDVHPDQVDAIKSAAALAGINVKEA
ncbi:MAG: hypothetical protein ACM3UO_00195 [Bacillota bacterium]